MLLVPHITAAVSNVVWLCSGFILFCFLFHTRVKEDLFVLMGGEPVLRGVSVLLY